MGNCQSSIGLGGQEVMFVADWRRGLGQGCGHAWVPVPMGRWLALAQNECMMLPSHLLEAAGLQRQIDLAVREVFLLFQLAILHSLHT